MSDRIDEALLPSDRWRVAGFLQDLIDSDPIDQILARSAELENGRPSLVLQVNDAQGLAGALHIGPDYDDAAWALSNGGDPTNGDLLLKHTQMLHSIAVRPDRRRSGLGSKLLHEAERRALASGTLIIFGVADGPVGTDEFYTRHGYTVGPAATPLLIVLGNRSILFPLEDTPARWFVKILNQPSQRRRLFRRAPEILADAIFVNPDRVGQLREALS